MIAQRRIISTARLPYSAVQVSRKSIPRTTEQRTIIDIVQRQPVSKHTTTAYSSAVPSISNIKHQQYTNLTVAPLVGFHSAQTISVTNKFNIQTSNYINAIGTEQARLTRSNIVFLNKVYSSGKPLTATNLRNKNDWTAVKNLVVRDELMKLQMGGSTNLPMDDQQIAELTRKLKGLNLADLSDSYINSIINDVLSPNDQLYIDALKAFKKSGKVSSFLQLDTLDELREYLDRVDLGKITAKQLKDIKKKYCEELQVHHRTSISSDASVQNNINNQDTVNTSQHKEKHRNPETGKIDYKRKLNEEPLDRIGELKEINKKRVFNKTLSGIGLAAAIGLGTGFAIGFTVNLAQNGLNPESLRNAFIAGARQGSASALMAAGSAVIGITVGAHVGGAIASQIIMHMGSNLAQNTVENIQLMCNSGVVGLLTIFIFSVYEFSKLKLQGYSTKESLLRTAKSAALSLSILVISTAAIGLWGELAGIAISIVSTVIMTGYSVYKTHHDKHELRKITFYSVELCRPTLLTV